MKRSPKLWRLVDISGSVSGIQLLFKMGLRDDDIRTFFLSLFFSSSFFLL